ncbi:MAG: hypothetical protein JNL48_12780 [Acidobacteria bacterium]|nr:hypothetical protein [Acidobacteriota bacterium]
MRLVLVALALALVAAPVQAQTKKTPARRPAPARKVPARPSAPVPLTRVPATLVCPSELGDGVTTKRRFCDVLTGLDPRAGVVITVPPHRGPVTLSFEVHNRHTYSAELVKKKQGYRRYTATIGVLLMDGTLIDRAVVDSEFRTERDLYDRVGGGAGPGGVKAVAPTGAEFVQFTLPEGTVEASVLGERLTVVRPDGTDQFTAPGRPVATISNVMLEYRPGPPPKKR